MHSFNIHFAQAQMHNYTMSVTSIRIDRGASPIFTRIGIPKDRLAIFTNYPNVNQGPGITHKHRYITTMSIMSSGIYRGASY